MHSDPLSISFLADQPDFIPALALWFMDEWADYFVGQKQEDVEAQFQQKLNRFDLPVALVAHQRGQPIGTVSLQKQSIESHRHLCPWIGGLYVAAQYRHQGVATRLVGAASALAKTLGHQSLFMAISGGHNTYERQGWAVVDTVEINAVTWLVMRLKQDQYQ